MIENIIPGGAEHLQRLAESHSTAYQQGNPFPNIVFEDFFKEEFLDEVLAEFPDLAKRNTIQYENAFEKKFAGRGEQDFGLATRQFMHFLNSEPFLQFLQKLTGIEEILIGDPYYIGGGQHEIKRPFSLINLTSNSTREGRFNKSINFIGSKPHYLHFVLEEGDTTCVQCNKQTNYYCKQGNHLNQSCNDKHGSLDLASSLRLTSDRFHSLATNTTNTKTCTNRNKSSTDTSTHKCKSSSQ